MALLVGMARLVDAALDVRVNAAIAADPATDPHTRALARAEDARLRHRLARLEAAVYRASLAGDRPALDGWT